MRSFGWHARIECAGQVVGAGFLVTPDKVLTCAHVVHGSAEAAVTVSFPQLPAAPPVPARVVVHGGWSGGVTDAGDMAVLELDYPVSLARPPSRRPGPSAEVPPPNWSRTASRRGPTRVCSPPTVPCPAC
ncbi:serine protease [Streptomyces sp. HUAS TT20]|uniref:serine protease n=1 Tax=Streptomyces sp. HUAS TT20 TaxID=3447509 RepID=UPI0021D9BE58|nr:serine protease [Streptomyces sp. HUAS 15-9]UXY31800.1 serine protease [Streptomyces sp. HUAS 15-9]